MEKRTPTYDLQSFIGSAATVGMTITATKDAAALGYSRDDVTAVIQTMERAQFYKSMTSYNDHREWQDVYHVPHDGLILYVKFVADILTDFRVLSFKEK